MQFIAFLCKQSGFMAAYLLPVYDRIVENLREKFAISPGVAHNK